MINGKKYRVRFDDLRCTMGKGVLSKVMKYELSYMDGCGEFREMQKRLWDIQKQTRIILNETTRLYYLRSCALSGKESFSTLDDNIRAMSNNEFGQYVYHSMCDRFPDMNTGNISATVRKAARKYNESSNDIKKGKKSLPSYRENHPVILRHDTIKISKIDGQFVITASLFSKQMKKKIEGEGRPRYIIKAHDNTQRAILERLLDRTYKHGECQLAYNQKKKIWELLLTYNFIPQTHELDPNKILGVDLGECVAIYASIYGENEQLKIEGGEVTQFARKHEARIRSMQKQAPFCGKGRIGHGTKTRVANVYQAKDKVAQFRNTINHRYSKALVEFARKHQCGVIQMEKLTGIKEKTEYPKFLRHWTYYDLQTKIKAKAEEYGIIVKEINPQYTSQRCSKCGYIDRRNRKSQAEFCCLKCNESINADYNASQNIAIADIEEIIKETINANRQ